MEVVAAVVVEGGGDELQGVHMPEQVLVLVRVLVVAPPVEQNDIRTTEKQRVMKELPVVVVVQLAFPP